MEMSNKGHPHGQIKPMGKKIQKYLSSNKNLYLYLLCVSVRF